MLVGGLQDVRWVGHKVLGGGPQSVRWVGLRVFRWVFLKVLVAIPYVHSATYKTIWRNLTKY